MHKPPIPGRPVSVIPHDVQVELVVGPVDGHDPVQVTELLVVTLVSSAGLKQLISI
jgi:hypothetical protein